MPPVKTLDKTDVRAAFLTVKNYLNELSDLTEYSGELRLEEAELSVDRSLLLVTVSFARNEKIEGEEEEREYKTVGISAKSGEVESFAIRTF